jgi:hypothetical protein
MTDGHIYRDIKNKVKGGILNRLFFIRGRNGDCEIIMTFFLYTFLRVRTFLYVFIFILFQLLNFFYEIWYGHFACGGHPNAVFLSYISTISNNNTIKQEILA